MSSEYCARPVSAERLIDAVTRIHRQATEEHPEKLVLDTLTEVFGFDYLLLARQQVREDGIWFEGKLCAGKCPSELITATRRRCLNQAAEHMPGGDTEDILCYVSRENKILRVDPEDYNDPHYALLHRRTVDTFRYKDPIYFIPLPNRKGEPHIVIHASLPRDKDPGLSQSFLRDLLTLSTSAGLAIENAELHSRLKIITALDGLLFSIRSSIDALDIPEEQYKVLVNKLQASDTLKLVRCLLFRPNDRNEFWGIAGFGPLQNEGDLDVPPISAGEITIDKHSNSHDSIEWPNDLITTIKLSLASGSPSAKCASSLQAVILSPGHLIDPALAPYLGWTVPKDTKSALIPISISGGCEGILYVDSIANTCLEDWLVARLSTRISSIIQTIELNAQRVIARSAFADLITNFERLSREGFDIDQFFQSLISTLDLLGAANANIVKRSGPSAQWEVVSGESSDFPNSFWSNGIEALQSNQEQHTPGQLYSAKGVGEFVGRHIFVCYFPIGLRSEEYALCVEPKRGAFYSITFKHSLSIFSIFSSAMIELAERARYQNDNLRALIGVDAKIFAPNLFRLTAHESRSVLYALELVVERILLESSSRLANKDVLVFTDLEKRITAGVSALTTYLSFLDDLEKRDKGTKRWAVVDSVARQVRQLLSPKLVQLPKAPTNLIIIEVGDLAVKMDEADLTIVLYNLLSNAIKAVRNIVNPTIKVKAELLPDRKFVQITVIDNGVGITKDEKDFLFVTRYSGFAKRAGEEGGDSTGVGLLGLKLLIDRYGGRIQLNSANGQTQAIVSLPGNSKTLILKE